MLEPKIKDLIAKHGLDGIAKDIESVSRPCIVGSTTEAKSAIGDSKVGGLPHARNSFEWPFFTNAPLEFVAQINCAQCGSPHLPDKGLLLFFCDWRYGGYSLKEAGFIRVIYYPDMSGLSTRPSPQIRRPRLWGLLGHTIQPRIYQEASLTFEAGVSLPDPERDLLPLSDEETMEAYCELKAEMEETRFIQIGGFPNPVQTDDMEPSIAKMTGRGTPEDWILILEVYDDSRTDMMWGDAGKLHFFCHIEDLKSLDFSRCWMQMQCG